MKNILMYVVENNETNINNKQGVYSDKRLYEDEVISSVKSWRKNGGWLKNIDIYVVCPTKNLPEKTTIDTLKSLDVIYLEEYMEETEGFECGYWSVPLVGRWMEQNIEFDNMIHIDCDMSLLRPLPLVMFTLPVPVCGIYDINSAKDQRQLPPGWSRPFDTGFTISSKDSKFYELFEEVLFQITEDLDPLWVEYCSDRPFQDIEEFAMDKIYNENMMEIITVMKYQAGEGYADVDTYDDFEVRNVYFWHEHKMNQQKEHLIRERVQLMKRIRNVD